MPPRIVQQLVQRRPPRLRAANPVVHILLHDLEPALGGELPKVVQLRLGMLVNGGNAGVEGGSFHLQ
jgi:hypothetical protein